MSAAYLAWAGSSLGLAAIACAGVAVAWLIARSLRIGRWTSVRDLALGCAVVGILALTLRPGMLVQFGRNWQVIPFGDLLDALPRGPGAIRIALAEIAANVFLFVPLGAALAFRWPALSAARVVGIATALSIVIELVQGFSGTGRTAQITDVLMNALGAWIGCQLVGLLGRAGVSAAVRRRR